MLPQTFRIPGRRHNYVDLNDVFEMYALTGRFRDWVRRVVRPLLSTAVIEYDKAGADPREKNYAIAEANAVALIATLPEEKRQAVRRAIPAAPVVASPAPAPAARRESVITLRSVCRCTVCHTTRCTKRRPLVPIAHCVVLQSTTNGVKCSNLSSQLVRVGLIANVRATSTSSSVIPRPMTLRT